jgi:hypothetical protein
VKTTGVHNRPVWLIESDNIQVMVTECGAHVAEITSKRSRVSPLWIQDRHTIDSDQYDPLLHSHLYGNDGESKLLAGLLGHNLCLPYWGSPTDGELKAGMTCHGETNIVRWQLRHQARDTLILEAHLPESRIRVERIFRCNGSLLDFETMVENTTAWDRPLAWCEHVSYGPPFLSSASTGFFANLGEGFKTSGDTKYTFGWPEGRGAIICNLSRFSEQPHSDLVNSFLVDTSGPYAGFAAWNSQLCSLLGYVFRVDEFPWLNVWENHDHRGKTRGMEFSNTPVEGTMKALMAQPQILRTPTFQWLGAKSRLRKSFFSFSLDIPQQYRGVASIHFDGRRLLVKEVETGNEIELIRQSEF